MTAITFHTAPHVTAVASTLKSFCGLLGDALDKFAMYRMQHAVPESEIRRAEREIAQYRQRMRTDHTSPVDSMQRGC
jgi:hypothetical protein